MVHLSPSSLLERARTPGGRKLVRYSLVSVVSVVVSQIILFIAQFQWSARTSNIIAVCLSAVPSYQLNRAWAWGKTGRSHLMKEIVPFWGMALLGLILSTWSADWAESHAASFTSSHLGQKLVVNVAALAAFGVLWIAKFVILNKVLFAHPDPAHPAPPPEPEPVVLSWPAATVTGRFAVALLVLLALGPACVKVDTADPPATSTPGPTIVVAGDPVPVAQMTDALANLCTARDEAADRPQAAEARFFDRSHTTLHLIARAVEDVDRPLAARLLEAKQKVEADFSGLASGDRVADDLGPLVAVTADALDRLAVPLPPCAK